MFLRTWHHQSLIFGNPVCHCVYNIYDLFRWINLLISVTLLAFFYHGNLSLFLRILNWSATESKTFRCPTITTGKGVGGVTLESESRRAEWAIWEKCVVFSGYQNKQCQDCGAWLLKNQFDINKSAIITKGKVPFTLLQASWPWRSGRGIALPILNLGNRRWWVVSTTRRPLYPREKPGTHCMYKRLGGTQGRSGRVRKISPHRDSIPGPSST
jgi:hypothetical protein